MIGWLAHRRFNFIDGLGLVWMALAIHERNWLSAIVIAALFPLASVLAERAQAAANKENGND